MENREVRTLENLTPDQAAVVRLLDRALTEGMIREDRLQHYLDRLDLAPEVVSRLYEQLQAENVRVISEVEEPGYTPGELQMIRDVILENAHRLSERELKILTMRFMDHKTLAETAEQMGLTRERIRQIENKVIRQVQSRPHRRRKIRDFYE